MSIVKDTNFYLYVGTSIFFCHLPLCGFNGWWMLFDVIIANLTCTYLVLQAILSHGVIVIIAT